MGERGIDLQRLPGDTELLVPPEGLKGPHVVKPVGQLDEDDADILGHDEKHLAQVFGLVILEGLEGELAQLGDAVDEGHHLGAETLPKLGLRHGRVLQNVVEKGRREGVEVDLHIGEDHGHVNDVDDVGLARRTELTAVGRRGDDEGLAEAGEALPVQVEGRLVPEFLPDQLDRGHPLIFGETSDEAVAQHPQGLALLASRFFGAQDLGGGPATAALVRHGCHLPVGKTRLSGNDPFDEKLQTTSSLPDVFANAVEEPLGRSRQFAEKPGAVEGEKGESGTLDLDVPSVPTQRGDPLRSRPGAEEEGRGIADAERPEGVDFPQEVEAELRGLDEKGLDSFRLPFDVAQQDLQVFLDFGPEPPADGETGGETMAPPGLEGIGKTGEDLHGVAAVGKTERPPHEIPHGGGEDDGTVPLPAEPAGDAAQNADGPCLGTEDQAARLGHRRGSLLMDLARQKLSAPIQGDQRFRVPAFAEEDRYGPVGHVEPTGGVETGNDAHDQIVDGQAPPVQTERGEKGGQPRSPAASDPLQPLSDEGPIESPQGNAVCQRGQGDEIETLVEPASLHSEPFQGRPEDGRGAEATGLTVAVDLGIDESPGPCPASLVEVMIEDDDGNACSGNERYGLDVAAAAVEDDEEIASFVENPPGRLGVETVALAVPVRNIIAHPGLPKKAELDGEDRRGDAVHVVIAVDDETTPPFEIGQGRPGPVETLTQMKGGQGSPEARMKQRPSRSVLIAADPPLLQEQSRQRRAVQPSCQFFRGDVGPQERKGRGPFKKGDHGSC